MNLIGARFVDREVVIEVSESNMEYCTIFRGVDVLSSEHSVAGLFYFGFAEEGEEGFEDGFGD